MTEPHCSTCRCYAVAPGEGEHGICSICGWKVQPPTLDTRSRHCEHSYASMHVLCNEGEHAACQRAKDNGDHKYFNCVCECHTLIQKVLDDTIAATIGLARRLAADDG